MPQRLPQTTLLALEKVNLVDDHVLDEQPDDAGGKRFKQLSVLLARRKVYSVLRQVLKTQRLSLNSNGQRIQICFLSSHHAGEAVDAVQLCLARAGRS